MSNRRKLKLRPEAIAMLDQADAAAAHAEGVMHAMAEHDGTKVRYVYPGPVFRRVAAKLFSRLLAGQLRLCPHLSWTAPQPAFWLPWAPGKLRCAGCNAAQGRRIRGTREDNICDGCGKYSPRIHCDTANAPPMVVDTQRDLGCFPPLLIQYGLCPACQEADLAGARDATT